MIILALNYQFNKFNVNLPAQLPAPRLDKLPAFVGMVAKVE